MNKKFLLASAVSLAFITTNAFATGTSESGMATVRIGASLIEPTVITDVENLEFGTIILPSSDNFTQNITVTMTRAGVVTSEGGATIVSSADYQAKAGKACVEGVAGNRHWDFGGHIADSSSKQNFGTEQNPYYLTVADYKLNNAIGDGSYITYTTPTSSDQFDNDLTDNKWCFTFGGTLSIPQGTKGGRYEGAMTMYVTYEGISN